VAIDKLPTPERLEEIKKEEETLPPPLTSYGPLSVARRYYQQQSELNRGWHYYLEPGQGGGFFHPGVIGNPPTEPEQ
jgi:hypothetical protein